MNAVTEHYWWPGMRSFIKNYVKGCGICQQFKINRNPSNPSYNPIPGSTTTRPFENCSMNLITDLPPIKLENRTIIDALMVMVDHGLTKGVVLTPVLKTLTEKGAGEILLNQHYKKFGLPDSMISDQGLRPSIYSMSISRTLTTPWNQIETNNSFPPTIWWDNRTI